MKQISQQNAMGSEPSKPTSSPLSPTQTITEKQYRDLLSSEKLLKERLGELSKTIGAKDTLEAKQLQASLATVEQSKEYVMDQGKVSTGKNAAFDLLSHKVKVLEAWEAQGNPVIDLESFRAHYNKLAKALGYDDDFIKKSTGHKNVSSPVSAEEAQRASHSATAATKELSALEATVSKKWSDRSLGAVERFRADLSGSEGAKQNPMKALTAALALSEAVSGARRADYLPNSKHSAIPTLVGPMSQDIATWGQFPTKDGGIVASVAAEATQKGLDVATVMGGFYALDKAVSNTAGRTTAGQAVGSRLFGTIGTRVLGVAGVAYHGYSAFADGSFQNMNNTQATGAVASPIVGGAAVGGIIAGPIGAGVGAGVGAVGEGVGLAVGYMRLEGEINRDWNKREVRDSIKFARAGFVHDDKVIALRKDIPLSAEAVEVIEHQARAVALSKNLTDGRGWYNPVRLYAGNPIDEVRGASPPAASEFLNAYATAKTALNDLYQRSMRITYRNEANRVAAEFEVDTTAALCGSQITSDMSPLEVIGALNQSFLGLPEILKHTQVRLTGFGEHLRSIKHCRDLYP